MSGNFNNIISIKLANKPNVRKSISGSFELHKASGLKIMRPRSCGDMSRIEIIEFLHTSGSPENLRLETCGYKIAHPTQDCAFTSEGSADEYFINNEMNAFGVADGVGEWENYKVDPRHFPTELIFHC